MSVSLTKERLRLTLLTKRERNIIRMIEAEREIARSKRMSVYLGMVCGIAIMMLAGAQAPAPRPMPGIIPAKTGSVGKAGAGQSFQRSAQ